MEAMCHKLQQRSVKNMSRNKKIIYQKGLLYSVLFLIRPDIWMKQIIASLLSITAHRQYNLLTVKHVRKSEDKRGREKKT